MSSPFLASRAPTILRASSSASRNHLNLDSDSQSCDSPALPTSRRHSSRQPPLRKGGTPRTRFRVLPIWPPLFDRTTSRSSMGRTCHQAEQPFLHRETCPSQVLASQHLRALHGLVISERDREHLRVNGTRPLQIALEKVDCTDVRGAQIADLGL